MTAKKPKKLLIVNDWLVEETDSCTCYGGGPYGHEPGCGLEPLVNLNKNAQKLSEEEKEKLLDRFIAKVPQKEQP